MNQLTFIPLDAAQQDTSGPANENSGKWEKTEAMQVR